MLLSFLSIFQRLFFHGTRGTATPGGQHNTPSLRFVCIFGFFVFRRTHVAILRISRGFLPISLANYNAFLSGAPLYPLGVLAADPPRADGRLRRMSASGRRWRVIAG